MHVFPVKRAPGRAKHMCAYAIIEIQHVVFNYLKSCGDSIIYKLFEVLKYTRVCIFIRVNANPDIGKMLIFSPPWFSVDLDSFTDYNQFFLVITSVCH